MYRLRLSARKFLGSDATTLIVDAANHVDPVGAVCVHGSQSAEIQLAAPLGIGLGQRLLRGVLIYGIGFAEGGPFTAARIWEPIDLARGLSAASHECAAHTG